nr:pyridoxamine 5'-phosphate oxidase family protein [Zobellia laminariae]
MVKDLEISECMSLLSDNYVGHLGYIGGRSPFIVPVTYFFDEENKSIISYSAPGHKIVSMRTYGHVSLQVEDVASMFTWRSVLVNGTFEELKGSTAKNAYVPLQKELRRPFLERKGRNLSL